MDACARGYRYRQCLTRDRRLIDDGLPLDDDPVDRSREVIVHHYVVADAQRFGVDRDFAAVREPDPCGVLGAVEEIGNRTSRSSQSQFLQVLTYVEKPQHSECDHVLP